MTINDLFKDEILEKVFSVSNSYKRKTQISELQETSEGKILLKGLIVKTISF